MREFLISSLRDKHNALHMHAHELRGKLAEAEALLTDISKQTPEKPDYWASCSQCERNASDAEDFLEGNGSALTALLAAERERCAVIAETASPRHSECGVKVAAMIRRMK